CHIAVLSCTSDGRPDSDKHTLQCWVYARFRQRVPWTRVHFLVAQLGACQRGPLRIPGRPALNHRLGFGSSRLPRRSSGPGATTSRTQRADGDVWLRALWNCWFGAPKAESLSGLYCSQFAEPGSQAPAFLANFEEC